MKNLNKSFDSNLIVKSVLIILTALLSIAGINSLMNSLTLAHGVTSVDGQYVGRDFLYIYIAVKQAIAGQAAELYSNFIISGKFLPEADFQDTPAWPWPYPAHSFLFFYPFAIFPYFISLGMWLIFSLGITCFLLRKFLKLNWFYLFLVALNINVLVCLVMGQNPLILSSILAIGIYSLRSRPIIAAICFSIITIKPNFAFLIPIVLILGGYWRVMIYTVIATIFWVVATGVIFGWDIWLAAVQYNSGVWAYTMSNESWFLGTYSFYRTLIQLYVPVSIAAFMHAALNIVALYHLQKIWRRDKEPLQLWLSLVICILLLTPYSVAYDAVWITIPCFVWIVKSLEVKGESKIGIVSCLFLLQIFSFGVISMANGLALLIIFSALGILFILNSRYYAQIA